MALGSSFSKGWRGAGQEMAGDREVFDTLSGISAQIGDKRISFIEDQKEVKYG